MDDPETARRTHVSDEDLLVLYRGRPLSAEDGDRIRESGGRSVAARNAYCNTWGATFTDRDGYRLVLSHRSRNS